MIVTLLNWKDDVGKTTPARSARTFLARKAAEALADGDPPTLGALIDQRVIFVVAAQSGRLACELDDDTSAAHAFQRRITVAGLPRALFTREFPPTAEGNHS